MHIPGISLEHGGKTAVVTFGETAMNRRFVAWLHSVVGWLENETSISAVVFTGTRNVFITGADLTEVRQLHDRADVDDFLKIPHVLMERIFGMEKLTAAAINGHCLGGGLELALACDFRVAADLPAPNIGLPEIRFGLVPALGATSRILSVVPRREAIRLVFSGELLTGAEALKIRLVDEIVAPEQVLPCALARCGVVVENSAAAIRSLKRLLVPASERKVFADALRHSGDEFAVCCSCEDKNDRIDAFRRKSVHTFRQATLQA